jgi:purine-binding chemotaxis protein CheW
MGRAEAGQYLTFMLGKEMFAIGILGIKEIIEYGALTKVPMMPNFICGVINLRGRVVPVIDLAARFERPTAAITRRTCIVIVELELDAEIPAQHIGVLVDTVNEVVDIAAADIEPAPRFGTHIRTDFIKGLGRRGELFVILLNVQNALSMADISALE